jgi:hypothetical protein
MVPTSNDIWLIDSGVLPNISLDTKCTLQI